MVINYGLLIPKWVTPTKKDVFFYIHPKGNKKIKDDRAAKSKKRKVDKVKPDF
jgi:hypothetical protein